MPRVGASLAALLLLVVSGCINASQSRSSETRLILSGVAAPARSGGPTFAPGAPNCKGGQQTLGRRTLEEQPASSAALSNASSSSVEWSVLRVSHGGGLQTSASGLRFISVPHAVLLGTTIDVSQQESEEACAATCHQTPSCVIYNYCPPEAVRCEMDAALTIEGPRTCYQLQRQTTLQTATVMPLLGSGSGIATTAGAPLALDLADMSLSVSGYVGLPGVTLFSFGNFECPESFQEATCALTASDDPASFAAECDARAPRCTGFALLARSSIANINTKRIGILKDSTGTIAPHHIAYSPFSAVFLRSDAAALPPLPADPATANVPNAFGSHRNASWLVLMRPDAVLRTTQDGVHVIAATHTFLPGTQVSALSIEPSFDSCIRRCTDHPDCKSINWCPATKEDNCVIGTVAMPSLPPGACKLMWEASVPVTALANVSLPGYRQYLGQASPGPSCYAVVGLLGAYDLTSELCPDSLMPDHCRLEGTLEDVTERCRLHPNCSGFTWRDQPKPGVTNSSSGVLKGGGDGRFDTRWVNWNPGLSLFVKDGVELADAASLPLPSDYPPGAPPPDAAAQQPTAAEPDQGAAGLSAGAIAGIAVGAAAAVAAAAALAAAVWRQRRPRQHGAAGSGADTLGSPQHLLPTTTEDSSGTLDNSNAPLRARTSLASELPEVQLAESGIVPQVHG